MSGGISGSQLTGAGYFLRRLNSASYDVSAT